MKKRALTLLLALVMCLSLATPAMAETLSTDSLPFGTVQTNDGLDISIQDDFSGSENLTRGARIPTQEYNINGSDYRVNGIFDTTIYTEYYFAPDATGFLKFDLAVDWGQSYSYMRSISVTLWDRTAGSKVSTLKYYTEENTYTGLYEPTVYTGEIRFFTLDATHKYYLHISKTTDSINASITGTISTSR